MSRQSTDAAPNEAGQRILIVDDDPMYGGFLVKALSRAGYVPRLAVNLEEASTAYTTFAPDLVLLDVHLGAENGLDLFQKVEAPLQPVPCVVMTANATTESAVRALRESAIDYVEKGDVDIVAVVGLALQHCRARQTIRTFRETMAECERIVAKAEAEVQRLRSLQRRATAPVPLRVGDLTDREWEVVQQVHRGHSNKEIAAELHVSRHTVSNHLRSIFRKLGVGSRTELITRLYESGGLHR